MNFDGKEDLLSQVTAAMQPSSEGVASPEPAAATDTVSAPAATETPESAAAEAAATEAKPTADAVPPAPQEPAFVPHGRFQQVNAKARALSDQLAIAEAKAADLERQLQSAKRAEQAAPPPEAGEDDLLTPEEQTVRALQQQVADLSQFRHELEVERKTVEISAVVETEAAKYEVLSYFPEALNDIYTSIAREANERRMAAQAGRPMPPKHPPEWHVEQLANKYEGPAAAIKAKIAAASAPAPTPAATAAPAATPPAVPRRPESTVTGAIPASPASAGKRPMDAAREGFESALMAQLNR